jgi:hypothetical protein
MNYTLNSGFAEGARNNETPKQIKAKDIFLGVDARLKSNQVVRKFDNSAIGAVQSFGFEKPQLCPKATELSGEGLRGFMKLVP